MADEFIEELKTLFDKYGARFAIDWNAEWPEPAVQITSDDFSSIDIDDELIAEMKE